MQLSNLIKNLPPYHFANAKKRVAERRVAGVDVIDLSMGDPDLPAPQVVVDRLCEALQKPENHRYPEYRGMLADRPKAGLYVWAAIPGGRSKLPLPTSTTAPAPTESRDFAGWLFDEAGVFVTPGTNFGEAGEGYVRISLTSPDERIEAAVERMRGAIKK